jgi:hypothetical protein
VLFGSVPIIAPMKLSRQQIKQGLDQVPMVDILGPQAAKALTPKQQAFAKNLAHGDGPSEALRKAYGRKGNPKTIANDAYKLRQNPDVITMQEAYSAALEGQRYQTPAALRALVIDSLVKVIIDPEANHGQVVAAAKVLGTVTEVAAFTERKEVHTITSSDDARAKVMNQLRDLMKQDATDVQAVEIEAQSLEDELRATHATPTTPNGQLESLAHIHTIPLKQSPPKLTPSPLDDSAPPSVADDLETPPGHVSKPNGLG